MGRLTRGEELASDRVREKADQDTMLRLTKTAYGWAVQLCCSQWVLHDVRTGHRFPG